MSDYPVLDGNGAVIIGTATDPAWSLPARHDYASDYPTRDGDGAVIVAAPFEGVGAPFRVTENILGAGGLDYALYDSSALDRMWQEATGQTPAAIASPVGLIVGRERQGASTFAQVMAGQAELSANTPDASGTTAGMSTATDSAIVIIDDVTSPASSGKAFRLANAQAASRFMDVHTTGVVAGRTYRLEVWAKGNDARDETFGFAGSGAQSVSVSLTTDWQRFVCILTANTTGQRIFIRAAPGKTTELVLNSVKEVPAYYARQSVSGARPVLQSDGFKFDGSDDNLMTDWFAQSGASCIIAQVAVPSTMSTYQAVCGYQNSSARYRLGFASSGRINVAIGNTSVHGDTTSPDFRGQSIVCGFAINGSVVRVFANTTMLPEEAQSGIITPSLLSRIGASDQVGTPGNFFGGSVKRLAFGKVFLTDEQFQQIRAEWLAAA